MRFPDDTEIIIDEPLDPLSEICQQGILKGGLIPIDDPYLVPKDHAEIDLSAGLLSERELAAYDAAIVDASGPTKVEISDN